MRNAVLWMDLCQAQRGKAAAHRISYGYAILLTLSCEQKCAWRRPVPCWPCRKLFSLAWAILDSEIASTQTCLVHPIQAWLTCRGACWFFCRGFIGSTTKAFQAQEPAQPLLADFIHPAHSCAAPSSACANTSPSASLPLIATDSSHPFVAGIDICDIADHQDKLDASTRQLRAFKGIGAGLLHSTTSSAHQPLALYISRRP